MKKKRSGYYGEGSDGTESESESPVERPTKRGAKKSSSSLGLNSQCAEDSPLDISVSFGGN